MNDCLLQHKQSGKPVPSVAHVYYMSTVQCGQIDAVYCECYLVVTQSILQGWPSVHNFQSLMQSQKNALVAVVVVWLAVHHPLDDSGTSPGFTHCRPGHR